MDAFLIEFFTFTSNHVYRVIWNQSTLIQYISAKVCTDSVVDVNFHLRYRLYFYDWMNKIALAVQMG